MQDACCLCALHIIYPQSLVLYRVMVYLSVGASEHTCSLSGFHRSLRAFRCGTQIWKNILPLTFHTRFLCHLMFRRKSTIPGIVLGRPMVWVPSMPISRYEIFRVRIQRGGQVDGGLRLERSRQQDPLLITGDVAIDWRYIVGKGLPWIYQQYYSWLDSLHTYWDATSELGAAKTSEWACAASCGEDQISRAKFPLRRVALHVTGGWYHSSELLDKKCEFATPRSARDTTWTSRPIDDPSHTQPCLLMFWTTTLIQSVHLNERFSNGQL